MALNRRFWSRVCVGLSVLNVGGMFFAMRTFESGHAMVHVVLAAGFGYWAWLLSRSARSREPTGLQEQLEQQAAALEDAQARLADQSAQLAELQERLDFAERILAQSRDRPSLGARDQGPTV